MDASNTFVAQLSDATGSFTSFTTIGTLAGTASGAVTATIPSATAAGSTYRVRVISTAPSVVGVPAPVDLGVNGLPNAQFSMSPNAVVTDGALVTFTPQTTNGTTYAWNLDAGAVPATSSMMQPMASYTTAGPKSPSLTVTDANGCMNTWTAPVSGPTSGLGLWVFSCNPPVPANANVVKGTDNGGGGVETNWVCSGAIVNASGGTWTNFVESGAIFNYAGSGFVSYVHSSAIYEGSMQGGSVVIYEPGATVKGRDTQLECPSLTFDYTNAPSGGCH